MKGRIKIKQFVVGVMAILFTGLSVVATGLIGMEKASAFSISPMNKTVVLDPGETYRDTIIISNPATSESDFHYKIVIKPYDVDDQNQDKYDSYSDRNLIVNWISLPGGDTGVIEPNNSVEVEYVVSVPRDAPSGGQYAAITVTSDDESESSQNSYGVQDHLAIAYLLYAEVAGQTVRQGEILDASVPGFLFSDNVKGASSVKNTGNVHGRASYILKVYPLFSSEELFTNEESPETAIILPDRTLYHETAWDETPMVGIFNVVYSVEFEGVTTEVSKMVIKCPIWLLFIIIAIIAAIIIWIVVRVRSRKGGSRE